MGTAGRANVVAGALWASIGVTMALDGGLGEQSQVLFLIATGLVLVAGISLLGHLSAAPPVLVLVLIGLLACASAIWTLHEVDVAVRTGTLTLALAAVAIVSARLAADRPMVTIGAPVAVIATVCGLVGLYGVATAESPLALRIEGVWRPAGPSEYPPALAMLEIMALPLLVRLSGERNAVTAIAAVLGVGVAAVVIVLAESRLGLVAGVLTAAVCALGPAGAFGSPRRSRVIVMTVAAGAALAGNLLAGGLADGRDGRGIGMVLALVAVLVASTLITRLLAERKPRGAMRWRPPGARIGSSGVWIGLAAAAICVALLAAVLTEREGPGIQGYAGPLHGREAQWSAALDVLAEHPFFGAGAGSYYQLTAARQGEDASLYAHSLPLETGAELGLVGLVLVIALYLAVFLEIRRARSDPALWLVAPGVVGFLAFGLVDWQFHLAASAAVWAALLGWLIRIAASPAR